MNDDGKEGDPPPHVEDPASRYPFISAALEAARAARAAGASPTDVRAAALAVAVDAPVEVRDAVLEVDPEGARLHRWDVNEIKEPWAAMACIALGLNHGFENFMLDNIGGAAVGGAAVAAEPGPAPASDQDFFAALSRSSNNQNVGVALPRAGSAYQVFDSGIDQSTFRRDFMRMREVDITGLNAHLLLRKSLSQVAEECSTNPVFSPVRGKGDLQLVEYLIAAGALRGIDVGSTIVAKALADTTAKAIDGRTLVNLRDNVWRAIEQVSLDDSGYIPPVLSIFDPDLDLSILRGYESYWSSSLSRQEYEEWVADDRVLKDRITIQAARDLSKKLDVNDEILAAMARPRGQQLILMNKILEDDERHRRFMAEPGQAANAPCWRECCSENKVSQIAEGFQRKVRFHDALLEAGRALGADRFLQLGWKCSVCKTQNNPTMTTCSGSACINEAPKGAETIPCKALRGLTKYDTRARLVLERLNIIPKLCVHCKTVATRYCADCKECRCTFCDQQLHIQRGLHGHQRSPLPVSFAYARVAVADGSELDDCSICYDKLDGLSAQVITPCGHYFHETCIRRWIVEQGRQGQNTCPYCRIPLTIADLKPANKRIYQAAGGAKKRKRKSKRGKKRGRKHRRSRK